MAAHQALPLPGVQPEQGPGGDFDPEPLLPRRRRHLHPGGRGGLCGQCQSRAREKLPGSPPVPPRRLQEPEQHHPGAQVALRGGIHNRRHRARLQACGRGQVDCAGRPVRDGDEGRGRVSIPARLLPRRHQRPRHGSGAQGAGRGGEVQLPRPRAHLRPRRQHAQEPHPDNAGRAGVPHEIHQNGLQLLLGALADDGDLDDAQRPHLPPAAAAEGGRDGGRGAEGGCEPQGLDHCLHAPAHRTPLRARQHRRPPLRRGHGVSDAQFPLGPRHRIHAPHPHLPPGRPRQRQRLTWFLFSYKRGA
mmetsp:Transcript_10052/g.20544  ORF Transcript_10052/g.20544 Transcript_10052/m.20544 type:complete len:303 (+) Transcript_10052:534-1442(+)